MPYAQKLFLGYFGQNWAKMKNLFFDNSLYIEVYKKAIKLQKYCLTKIIFNKVVF
jgi:hypothetical protein